MGKQPTKVEKIPEGYVFSHKDEVTGRDIYKKTSATPSTNIPVKPRVNKPVQTGTPTVLKKPIPRKTPPTAQEDFVYIEPTATTTTPVTPVVKAPIPINEDLRIDRKLQPPIHPNIDYYQYPDVNAGYSKSTPMYFDKTTQRPVDVLKSIGANGEYNPVYIDTTTANEGKYQGSVKQGNPRVTTTPTITNVMEGVKKERAGTKELGTTMGTVGFKKGGLVQKLALGGNINYDELNSGIVGQNDQYAAQQKEEQDKANKQNNARGMANTASQILGAAGSTYYSSQPTQNTGDATRNAAMSAVGQTGPIGGAISGISAFGDKIGKPIKARKERLNSEGKLVDETDARQTAIGASFLSPSKALATRSSYAGGWTDVSGKGYTASLEKKAQDQLNEVKRANVKSAQEQAILARNSSEFNPTISKPYDINGATFDGNQNLILANNQQFDPNRGFKKGGLIGKVMKYAKGGVIEGEGGPKEDKINAKIEAGSFVVPADKAKVAESLRATLLSKSPKIKANLNQKGGEKVKLSNGEHLFTPEEKEELKEKGVNMNALAPNAENKEEMMEKKSHIMIPGFRDGGNIPKGTKVNGATWDGKNWISANGDKYTSEKGKTFEAAYNAMLAKEKSNQEQRTGAELNLYKRKLEEAKKGDNQSEIDRLQAKVNSLSGIKQPTEEVVVSKTVTKPSLKAPKVVTKVEAGKFVPPVATPNVADEVTVPNGNLSPNEIARIKADEEKNAVQSSALNKSLPQTIATTSTPPQTSRAGILSKIGNIDPTMFVGAGQVALGLNMLGKEKRPIYNPTIDPTYNAAVNRAQQQANFGLKPEEMALANQDIQGSLNDAKMAGLNASGVQSFNTNRAAINDAWKAKLGLKVADQDLRMQKQKYADAMAADRAGILAQNRKDIFNNAMNTFQQKQQAGSELIGAGLQNAIGAYRFRKDQQARDEANAASNAWVNKL